MSSNTHSDAIAAPVLQSERLVILDSLRGFAILGILLMNVPGFGLAEIATSDPSILNETGINYNTWYFINWVLEGTQRALFSMLFGAGIILFITRQEKKLAGLMPADYFFRRQLWLLLFGLFHGFVLLWFWDVLFHYAIAGMILFAFRRLPPKKLLVAAGICLLINTAFDNVHLYDRKLTILRGELAAKVDTNTTKLTVFQQEALSSMKSLKESSTQKSKLEKVEKENTAMRSHWPVLWDYQSDKTVRVELEMTYYGIWDVLLFMLIGMALYKNGVLLGKGPMWLYGLFFIGGFGIGLLISHYRLDSIISSGFNRFEYTKNISFTYYQVPRLFRSFGFLGLIMVLYKSGWFDWLFALMRPVGQMAFTNYLVQSLIGLIFFYGIGFGNFGRLERHELYYYVAAVWFFQIIVSHIWLRYFRFGPFEWLWRTLTYWKPQSMKKAVHAVHASA